MKPRTTMTTVNGRPTPIILQPLTDSEGILVACRMATGEDVFIPLRTLFALFEHELVRATGIGRRNENETAR